MTTERLHETEWWFEDWEAGEHFRTMTRTPTEFDVMMFATTNGYFEEQWLNRRNTVADDALGRTNLVPGPLTLVMAEGLLVQTGRMHRAVALLGFDEVRFSCPVGIGDGIYAAVNVANTRRSSTSPDHGIVQLEHNVHNHDDVVVMTYRTARLIKSLAGTAAAGE